MMKSKQISVIPSLAKAGNTGTQELLLTLKALAWILDSPFWLSWMTPGGKRFCHFRCAYRAFLTDILP